MRSNYKPLGNYIREVNERNKELKELVLLGVSIQKEFIPSIANTIGTDMSTYKIVKKNQFAYGPVTSRNGDKISIALLDQYDEALISQSYKSFEIIDENELLPDYLMMWFRRSEFDRYARYMSHGSTRETFDWVEMCNIELPIPSPEKQREIVKEYKVIEERILLNSILLGKLQCLTQSIYKQWFVEFDFLEQNNRLLHLKDIEMLFLEELDKEIPKGWGVDELSNIVAYLNRGITPKYTEKDGIIVINQKCVRDNTIDFKFTRNHNLELKKIDKDKYLKKYDILINSTGTGTLGRVGLVKENECDMTVDTHVTIVRPSNTINSLYLWFNLSLRTDEIENLAEGSTGQTELGRNNLGELKVLIPDPITQKAFSDLVEPLISYSYKVEKEIPILHSLKKILLQKMVIIK